MNSHTNFRAAEGGSITRLVINRNGILVGEERDPEKKQASLFAVDLFRHEPLWSSLAIEEPWWLGLAEVTVDLAYVQLYAEGPLPTPAGVATIDLTIGKLLWTIPKVAYHQESGYEVILLQQGMLQEQYFAVDRSTGEMLRKVSAQDLPPRPADDLSHLSFPSIISADELGSSEVEAILERSVELSDLRGSIEYFKRDGRIILAFYLRDTKDAQAMLENKLSHEILIADEATGDFLFREQLGTSLNYPIQGSYFLYHDKLLYVKGSNELRSIELG